MFQDIRRAATPTFSTRNCLKYLQTTFIIGGGGWSQNLCEVLQIIWNFKITYIDKKNYRTGAMLSTIKTPLLNFKTSTILVIIFWEFLMFYQISISPQVRRIVINSNKHGIYELRHELPNNLRLRKLGNIKKISNQHTIIA